MKLLDLYYMEEEQVVFHTLQDENFAKKRRICKQFMDYLLHSVYAKMFVLNGQIQMYPFTEFMNDVYRSRTFLRYHFKDNEDEVRDFLREIVL